jgi:hypothetical protein
MPAPTAMPTSFGDTTENWLDNETIRQPNGLYLPTLGAPSLALLDGRMHAIQHA